MDNPPQIQATKPSDPEATQTVVGTHTSDQETGDKKLKFNPKILQKTWITHTFIEQKPASLNNTESAPIFKVTVPDFQTNFIQLAPKTKLKPNCLTLNHGAGLSMGRRMIGKQKFRFRTNQVKEQGGVLRVVCRPVKTIGTDKTQRQFQKEIDLSATKDFTIEVGFNNLVDSLMFREPVVTDFYVHQEEYDNISLAVYWKHHPQIMQFTPPSFTIEVLTCFDVDMIGDAPLIAPSDAKDVGTFLPTSAPVYPP